MAGKNVVSTLPPIQGREYTLLSDSELVARVIRKQDIVYPECTHPEAQISLFRRGSSAMFLTHSVVGRANRTSVAPGSVAYITHKQPHRTVWQGDGELMNLYFSSLYLEKLKSNHNAKIALYPLSYRQETVISAIGNCLLDELDLSGQLSQELVDHARAIVAMRLLRIEESAISKTISGHMSVRRLQPALDFLNAHPEISTNIANLAELCGASVFHFARSFKARFGSAPFEYQRGLRLQNARVLLSESDLSIKAVGLAIGIGNHAQFSRLFLRSAGVSPTEYRSAQLSTRQRTGWNRQTH